MIDEKIIKLWATDPKDWPLREYKYAAEEVAHNLRMHVDGVYDERVMNYARPNEEDMYKEYRKNVFSAPTKDYSHKVINNLSKMRMADDWGIEFKDDTTLQKLFLDYCTKSFPNDDSIENYFFSVAFKQKAKDPNTIVVCQPRFKPTLSTDYYQPVFYLYCTDQVIYCIDNELYVLMEEEKSSVLVGNKKVNEGLVIKLIDKNNIVVIQQTGKKTDYTFEIVKEKTFEHNLNWATAFKIGGTFLKQNTNERVYESFLSPCLTSWNEACRRESDHQVNNVINVHPDKWEVADDDCPTCKGTGEVEMLVGGARKYVTCQLCHGHKFTSQRSPFNVKYVRPQAKTGTKAGDNVVIPIPPMGNVPRDVEAMKFTKQEVVDKIYQGLGAINMEFFFSIPANQSGVAKAMDRQEVNFTYYQVQCDVIDNDLKPMYFFTALWMFGKFESIDTINEMQPRIQKAKKFDFINSLVLVERMTTAKTADLSPEIRNSLELDYIKEEFGEDSDLYKFKKTTIKLNPLPYKTAEEKMIDWQAGVITQDAYILSENIHSFVTRAYEKDDEFFEKQYEEQLTILRPFIDEVKKSKVKAIVPVQ
jgi:hypothetical protein